MIFAMDTAPADIPPNPNIAATRAIIKKMITNLSIFLNFYIIKKPNLHRPE